MNDPLNIMSVPLITMLVCGIIYVFEQVVTGKEKLQRLTPALAIVSGAVIGVVAFYAGDGIMPTQDVLTATLIGGASGLAATGSNSLIKQLFKPKENTIESQTTKKRKKKKKKEKKEEETK